MNFGPEPTPHDPARSYYRFRLRRTIKGWGSNVCWVMLNPSTADENEDDPTVRKCMGFSERLGFGTMTIVNLFAFRATDPKALQAAGYPIGRDGLTDMEIRNALVRATTVIVAWGANVKATGETAERAKEVLSMIHDAGHTPKALRITKSGQPGHPLYIPYSTKLVFFEARA